MNRLLLPFFSLFLISFSNILTGAEKPPIDKKEQEIASFIEPSLPFLRSALVFENENGTEYRVRRGILIPLDYQNRWACFDPDILQWVVVWEAPANSPPITLSSMAAVSYPDKNAKAKKAPRIRGKILLRCPLPAHLSSNRSLLTNLDLPVGPLPSEEGRYLGISLNQSGPAIHYQDQENTITETIGSDANEVFYRNIERTHLVEAHSPKNGSRIIYRNSQPTVIATPHLVSLSPLKTSPFPETYQALRDKEQIQGPFAVSNLSFPKNTRPVRPTDLAFNSKGNAYLVTLDGDLWRIIDIETPSPSWTRLASGLFEPMAIEIDENDRIFILGRDQITELLDRNNDGYPDLFRNASDRFLQTLHTRDYATSLALLPDGSFVVAKGGIFNRRDRGDSENAVHRGALIRLSADGRNSTVLADGLRLPFVGSRSDGTIFASDQQGHYVPSTPLYRITLGDHKTIPYYGFTPTDHRKIKTPTRPLLYYPYQRNRSGASFCQTSAKAFPSMPNTFLHLSWTGRLFAIETPSQGQAFSWELPLQLDFPALNGATHPTTGELYVVGLGISGYKPTTKHVVGLAAVREHAAFPSPQSIELSKKNLTITFHEKSASPQSLDYNQTSTRLFSLKRSSSYGSGHYRWDGEAGEYQPSPTAAQIEGRKLTLDYALLGPGDVFSLSIPFHKKDSFLRLYTSPSKLPALTSEEIADLTQQTIAANQNAEAIEPGDPKRGEKLYTKHGCASCHTLTGDKLVGPPLNKVATRLNANELRQSILEPNAIIAKGFQANMPSFAGIIGEQELADLVAYLLTLDGNKAP